jgi:hemolysin activation/secretion protein
MGVETDASLPRLFSSGSHFRPNILADTADQVGAAVTLRGERALGTQTQVGAEWSVEGGAGDFRFAKTSLSAHVAAPLGRRLAVGLEGAAGSSVGDVPIQSRFFLGGPATLRGYTGNAANGEAFWRARAELGNRLPAVRIALFGDAGWAGPRAVFNRTRALASVGIGVGLLDGLFRADLARAVRSPLGWRLDFYVDGVL